MSLNGKFLDKDHLQYFWTKIKMKFASAEQGAKADTAVQPSALTDYQTKLSGTNKLDPAYIEYDATHRAVTDTEKSTWNSKQDAISDLSTIRSGAAAGATALQQSDVTSTYSASGTAPVNGTAVNAAIGTLDVSSVGGAGKYISAISETDGKISATPTTFDTALSSSSTNGNAPTSKTVFDDQQRQEVEIGVVANAGAKNILRFTAKTETVGGVTFTVNADGSVTLNGTKTNNDWFYLSVGNELKKGTYIISSGLSAQNNYSVRLLVSTQESLGSAIMVCEEQQQTRQYTLDQDYSGLYYAIRVSSGTTIDNLTIKPMLRLASITDSTYEPYAKTNRELTVAEDEDRAALVQQVDSGAKNLVAWDIPMVRSLNPNATWTSDDTCVKGGITYKFNTDGTVVANGTADVSASKYIKLKSGFPVTKGLIASCGLPAVSQDQSKGLLQLDYPTGSDLNVYDYERSKEVDRDGTVELYITVLGGITVSNLIFKPMLCTAADYAVSPAFVPHARTNVELTAKEQQNENNILLNTKYGGGRNVGNFAYYGLNHDQSIAAGTITYTESNGVFTFTGAADSSKNYACYLLKKQIIKAGNYVVSGISGGSTSTYWFRIGTGISDTFKMNVTDSGTTLTLDSDTKITLQLVVKSGVSLSNKVFSPMIITAADWANSHDFQQYGESNAQLSSIVQVDIDNMTEFKFAKLDELSSSVHFKYGFLIGGGGASTPNKVMLWHIFVNTSNSVYFTKIIGDDTMTLTGSISDGVLTITSSATIYGGLRLIWLG